MNSYRTSIQWSRLIKDREGTINEAGVEDDYRIEFIRLSWRAVTASDTTYGRSLTAGPGRMHIRTGMA